MTRRRVFLFTSPDSFFCVRVKHEAWQYACMALFQGKRDVFTSTASSIFSVCVLRAVPFLVCATWLMEGGGRAKLGNWPVFMLRFGVLGVVTTVVFWTEACKCFDIYMKD